MKQGSAGKLNFFFSYKYRKQRRVRIKMSNNRRYQGKGQFWIIGMIKNDFKKLKVNWINFEIVVEIVEIDFKIC